MYRSLPLCFLIALSTFQSYSEGGYELDGAAFHVDARDMALGGLNCTLESLPNRFLECTCLMPFQLEALSIRKTCYHDRSFGMDWTFGWYQSGNTDWMENGLSMHVERPLNEHLHLGIEADVLFTIDAVERTSSTCFAEIDCRYDLAQNLTIGMLLMNPGGAQMHTADGKIPLSSTAFVGARYAPAKKCQTYGEIGILLRQNIRGSMGIEYALNDVFILRTGFSTSPFMPSWGIGGKIKKLCYSWAGNVHPILGFSNGFSLRYVW